MDLRNETVVTFAQRADSYDYIMDWVHLSKCISPMLIDPFGEGFALDACAGTGAVSKALISRGWSVFSLDLSKDMLNKGKLPIPVVGDIQSIPFLDNFFDFVVCRQGLQYTDLKVAIAELVRVSRNKVIVGHITKVAEDYYNFWDEYFRIASPGRKHIFTPGQIQEIITSLGYRCHLLSAFSQQDNFLGPIAFLDQKKQDLLVKMLIDTMPEFKKLYNVIINRDGTILYDNRWEFICIEK